MPTYVQVFELLGRPPGQLKSVSILEASIQQRVAAKEIHRDLWKQDQVNSLYGEWWTLTMILQNVQKNSLIVNTILETQT